MLCPEFLPVIADLGFDWLSGIKSFLRHLPPEKSDKVRLTYFVIGYIVRTEE